MKQINFFAEENRLERLSEIGDPLEKISATIDFEIFRPILNRIFRKEIKSAGGRPPWDYVMMFKILVLQKWYSIADDKTEYVINDRLSFQRFLGISLGDKVPDAKTIWLFRENLTTSGAMKELFDLFENQMESQGVITRKGSIIDATFADAPRQRNSRDENKIIKEGNGDELWEENEHKRRQKDIDARWTKKNDETHFGYKDHVKVDKDSKMIVDYTVTDASVHDSKQLVDLIDEQDEVVYADSAYAVEGLEKDLLEKNPTLVIKIHEKGYRNKPLTEEQKENNKNKSKIRVRVEHVFGHMTISHGEIFVRSIGDKRAECNLGIKNLAYNLQRYETMVRLKKVPVPI